MVYRLIYDSINKNEVYCFEWNVKRKFAHSDLDSLLSPAALQSTLEGLTVEQLNEIKNHFLNLRLTYWRKQSLSSYETWDRLVRS